MTESRASTWWMTVAVVGAALLALFSVVVGAVNYERLEHQSSQRAHDQKVQVAQAKSQSDAQVAQAKKEAAEQVAVAKAEVQAELCGLTELFPPSAVLARVKAKEHCAATATSTAPAPSSSVPPAGQAHARASGPGTAGGTAHPSAHPTSRPTAHPPPRPSPTPSPPGLLCRILDPLIPLGDC